LRLVAAVKGGVNNVDSFKICHFGHESVISGTPLHWPAWYIAALPDILVGRSKFSECRVVFFMSCPDKGRGEPKRAFSESPQEDRVLGI
jgi:hypothetical protein